MANAKTTLNPPPALDLSKYIEVRLFGERPHIRGRRIPVATIAYNHRDNAWTVGDLAYNFTLSEAEVLAALLYYDEHRTDVDAQEKAYQDELNDDYERYRAGS